MLVINSINKIPIRLTNERWEHIVKRHPEMQNQLEKVLATVENPQYILEGDYGELLAVNFYERTPLSKKYLVVVYKEVTRVNGFVVTAYFTREPSRRRKMIWKS